MAGDDTRPIERYTKTVNVRGADKHEIPNVPVATVGATIPNTSRGAVVGIWHNYGYIGSDNSVNSAGQMKWQGLTVEDRSVKVGGKQKKPLDGFVIPLIMESGLWPE